MKSERGLTLLEVLLVLGVAGLALISVTAYSLPLIAREAAKSSMYNLQTLIQLARVESVNRNRMCYFVLNTRRRALGIRDTMGTVSAFDDVELHRFTLPATVSFTSPDTEPPVDLVRVGPPTSPRWRMDYSPQGSVTNGGGHITIVGGEYFIRLELFKAGGTRVRHWNGGAWETGT